jgi:HSP20 family protein
VNRKYKHIVPHDFGLGRSIEDFVNDLFRGFDTGFNFDRDFLGKKCGCKKACTCVVSSGRSIVLDLIEEDDKYIVEAELPGLKKDEIKIELTEDDLVISMEREDEGKQPVQNYLVKSRRYTKEKQHIYFKQKIDVEKVESSLLNGVLKLEIGKAENKGKKFIEL